MSRVVHYTAVGFKPQLIEIASDCDNKESKRSHIIEEEDQNLNHNLNELEEGTRARNREIIKRLNEVWSQTSAWEAKMLTEEKEAEESIVHIRREYERHIYEFQEQFLADVEKAFKHIDNDLIPPQIERVIVQENDVDHFVKKTVPQTIENQSGEVSRQLKKQYETFDIEKQKGLKKESKFLQKANQHLQHTAQRFTDEDALLAACFFNLEEDINNHERRASRMHLRRYDNACKSILELDVKIAAILEKRRSEDVDVLDTIIETQSLLQTTILEHFGSDSQAKTFGEKPNFKKLESRMASRGSSRGGSGNGSQKGTSSVLSKLPPSSGNKANIAHVPKPTKGKK